LVLPPHPRQNPPAASGLARCQIVNPRRFTALHAPVRESATRRLLAHCFFATQTHQFRQVPAQFRRVPEPFGQTAEEFRRVPEWFGQLPETFGRVPEEFRQLTEKVRFVPEERGELPEEFRRTAKELRRGAVAKIFPKIFMRGYGMI